MPAPTFKLLAISPAGDAADDAWLRRLAAARFGETGALEHHVVRGAAHHPELQQVARLCLDRRGLEPVALAVGLRDQVDLVQLLGGGARH